MCKSTWFKFRDPTKVQSILKDLISPARFSTPPPPIQWGTECEPKAVACYIGLKSGTGTVVEECGLFVHPTHCFLVATPDRLVVDPTAFAPDGLLEVKCPWSCKDKTVVNACQDSSFCCELQCGSPRLKVTHTYHYQVQGQMAVTGRSWCDFMVYTNVQVHIERIFFHTDFWSTTEAKLLQFYHDCVLPQLVHCKGPCVLILSHVINWWFKQNKC